MATPRSSSHAQRKLLENYVLLGDVSATALRFASPLGDMLLHASATALHSVWFIHYPHLTDACQNKLADILCVASPTELPYDQSAPGSAGLLAQACTYLHSYFAGQRPGTMPPLAPQGTLFQQTVWQAVASIAYGQTISYAQLAERLGSKRLTRAAANAVGRNPLGIFIPCHRVMGSSGALTGYAGGLDKKHALLQLETGSV